MLMHPTSIFPPPSTAAIIVDDLSNLILGSFPKHLRNKSTSSSILQDRIAQRVTSRRFQVIENLASSLSRLAASRHLALVVLNNATTSLKGGQKAILKPALSGQAWDAAINTRIALYRDLSPSEQRDRLTWKEQRGYRLAAIVRLSGRDVYREAIPFLIQDSGLHHIDLNMQEDEASPLVEHTQDHPSGTQIPNRTLPPSSPANDVLQPDPDPSVQDPQKPNKRKAVEIADSDEEDDNNNKIPHETFPASTEPDLPEMPADDEEILFDTHEKSIVEKEARR